MQWIKYAKFFSKKGDFEDPFFSGGNLSSCVLTYLKLLQFLWWSVFSSHVAATCYCIVRLHFEHTDKCRPSEEHSITWEKYLH